MAKSLLEHLKKYNIVRPTLARADPYQRFCIKIDLSKDGIVAVLLQVDESVEAK